MDESGTMVPKRATERPWEVFMYTSSYRDTTWRPIRESAIVGLCVLMPIVFLGQVIALVYANGPV